MGLPHEEMQSGGKSGQGTGKDAGTIATFFKKGVYMSFKSKEEGREIYEEMDYISLRCSAQKKSISTRKLTEADKQRFPHIWDAYLKQQDVEETGTDIAYLPDLSSSQVLMLKSADVPTIEALSCVPDGNIKALGPGGLELKKRAKLFLEGKEETSVKLEEANDRIAKLEAAVKKLSDAAANPVRKKPGPKPKNKHEPTDDSPRHAE